jgi:hypothetical protein
VPMYMRPTPIELAPQFIVVNMNASGGSRSRAFSQLKWLSRAHCPGRRSGRERDLLKAFQHLLRVDGGFEEKH